MSTSFHANQYESAFVPHRLQNWEKPMKHKKATWFNNHYVSGRPDSQDGFTQILSNDRGHLLENVPRSSKNPWGNFVGTWDLPKQIPGNSASCKTARRADAHDKLHRKCERACVVIKGEEKNDIRQQNNAFRSELMSKKPVLPPRKKAPPEPSPRDATPDAQRGARSRPRSIPPPSDLIGKAFKGTESDTFEIVQDITDVTPPPHSTQAKSPPAAAPCKSPAADVDVELAQACE